MKTFSRGIHPGGHKAATEQKAISEAALPQAVILPLLQNLGCPCEPLIKVGEEVVEGQKIAASPKYVGAPLHAPISGKVTHLEYRPNPGNFEVDSIVIAAKAGITSEARYGSRWSGAEITSQEIKKIVKEAGIVGLGGAAFPTHVKLNPPADKKIDSIIINGCECEPFITADHRLMLERTEDLLKGAQAIAKAVGAGKILIGVEDNKKDAFRKIKSEILNPKFENENNFQVTMLKTKYPQGGEKMLIKALLNREVPSGGLPLDVGVIVNNVGTAVAIAEAIQQGRPLIKRVVTVTGPGIREPKNLWVRIGTPVRDLIEQCGGLSPETIKVIMGGPLTGIAIADLNMPIVKGTNCLLALTRKEAKPVEERDCIRCGKCLKACPIGLMPNYLANYTKLGNWEKVEEYHVADCIECGSCAYVCPSKIQLVHYFKTAKKELQIRKVVCQ